MAHCGYEPTAVLQTTHSLNSRYALSPGRPPSGSSPRTSISPANPPLSPSLIPILVSVAHITRGADVPPGQTLPEQRRDAEDQRRGDLDGLQDDAVGDRLPGAHSVGGEHDQAGGLKHADVGWCCR